MKKLVIILACVLYIVCLLSVGAKPLYLNVGSNETQFELGRGIFSAIDEVDVSYYSAGLSNGKHIPLVADADQDGINEVYIIDGDDIKVYEGIELEYQASFDYGTATDRVSFPIIYDIDDDGILEYIFVDESKSPYEELFILEFNGTHLNNQTSFQLSSVGAGDSMVACMSPNKCIVVAGKYRTAEDSPNYAGILAVSINSTEQVDSMTVYQDTNVNAILFCRSAISFIATTTEETQEQYVFSFGEATFGDISKAGVRIFWVSVNSTNELELEHSAYADEFQSGALFSLSDEGHHCDDPENIRAQFTSPLVSDDFADKPFSQAIIATMESDSEFVMLMYDYEGNFIDDYPETDDSNGVIISNVFRATAFPDDNGRSFCVVGFQGSGAEYETSDLQQNIVCASEYSGELVSTFEYSIPIASFGYNNSYNVGNHRANLLSHSAQHSNALSESVDLSEVLTTYGIFSLDYDSCEINIAYGRGFCDAERVFMNGAGKSAFMSVDIENIGSEDLIAMTDLGLYVYDDGIGNRPVKQVDIYYNPCPVDVIIKINETLLMTVTGYDGNSDYGLADDLLTYNATIYKDDTNEMTDSYENVTSGSPRSFTFVLNKTIASGLIEVIVSDNIAGNEPFIVEQTFSVGLSGVKYGDLTCTNSYGVEAEEGEINESMSLTPSETNYVKSGLSELNSLLGIGLLAIWIILMIYIDIQLIVNTSDYFGNLGSKYLFAIVIFVDLLWIFLGVMFAIVSLWLILLLIIFGIIVGVLFVANKIQSGV